ncbi:MAG: hypothetical protein K0R29_2648 [Pseudobdellovibrio sp.]|jgi:hypothetical protein|nr:hypothetical protein [Pseudobdellovibrio sp.]
MKKLMILLGAVVTMSFGSFAQEPAASDPNAPAAHGPKQTKKEMKKQMREEMKQKREMLHAKILEACGPDLQTAGCSGKTGGDMMQCMRTYKEAHPEFKVSDACREAHEGKRELKKEKRKMKKEMRNKIHQGAGGTPTIPPASGTTTGP